MMAHSQKWRIAPCNSQYVSHVIVVAVYSQVVPGTEHMSDVPQSRLALRRVSDSGLRITCIQMIDRITATTSYRDCMPAICLENREMLENWQNLWEKSGERGSYQGKLSTAYYKFGGYTSVY